MLCPTRNQLLFIFRSYGWAPGYLGPWGSQNLPVMSKKCQIIKFPPNGGTQNIRGYLQKIQALLPPDPPLMGHKPD